MGGTTWRGLRLWAVALLTLAGVLVTGPAARAAGGGAISGTVTDPAGLPLSGICVAASPTRGGLVGEATTDGAGHYRIVLGVSGDYRVEFGCRDGEWVRETYDDLSMYSGVPKTVHVANGEDVAGIDADLVRGGEVRGRVTDSTGAPVPNAWVNLCCPGNPNATTGPDGTYAIKGVGPGEYFAYAGGAYYGGADYETAARFIVASGRVRSGIDMVVPAKGAISGTVVDEAGAPISGLCVTAEDGEHASWSFGWGQTDGAGRYSLIDVPEGSWVVAFNTCWDQSWESTFYPDAPHPSGAQRVEVVAGQTTAGIDGVLTHGAVMTGVITGDDGQPLADACVSANPLPLDYLTHRYRRSSPTGADGRYRITGLTEGDYEVYAASCSWPTELLPRYYGADPGGMESGQGTPVPVDGAAEVSGIDMQLVKGGTVEGVVTGEGSPLAGLCVIAEQKGAPWFQASARAEADGHYRIAGLRTGDYGVAFFACGPEFQDLASEFHHDARSLDDATPVPVTAGSTTAGVDEDLARGAVVSGTITAAATGQPVQSCVTVVRDGSDIGPAEPWGLLSATFTAYSGPDGKYTVRGVPPGSYRVAFGCGSDSALATRWYDGAADEASATVVPLSAGQVKDGIDAALPPAPPQVLGLSASSAPTGAVVGVVGKALRNATEVRFGDTPSPRLIRLSANEVDAEVPDGAVGSTVDVTVVGPGGVSEVVPGGRFTFEAPPPPPVLSSLSPDHGREAGGETVVISGANLDGATAVRFGSTAASFSVIDGNTVNATAPAGAGAVDVTVTTPGGTSAALPYAYEAAPKPVVTGLSPNHGRYNEGTQIELTGTGLGDTASVRVGGQDATFWSASDTSLTVWVPPSASGPGTADVVVTSSLGAASDPVVFTYDDAPSSLGWVWPDRGPLEGGNTVTINGGSLSRVTSVTFGGVAASFTVLNDWAIDAVVPPGVEAGVVNVVATGPGGASNPVSYVYEAPPPSDPPQIWSVSSSEGPPDGGTLAVIEGSALSTATSVTFGGAPASFYVMDDGHLSVQTPAHPSGLVDVTVTNPAGSATLAAAFRYVGRPVVTSVSPSSGSVLGGTVVTLQGVDFLHVMSVALVEERPLGAATRSPVRFSQLPDGSLQFTTPLHLPGTVGIEVTTPYGTSDPSPTARFSYRVL